MNLFARLHETKLVKVTQTLNRFDRHFYTPVQTEIWLWLKVEFLYRESCARIVHFQVGENWLAIMCAAQCAAIMYQPQSYNNTSSMVLADQVSAMMHVLFPHCMGT